MGWSLKKAFKSVGKKVSSGVKSFTSKASSAVKSSTTVMTTGVKNLFSKNTLTSIIGGLQTGGIAGAITGGAVSMMNDTMTELDKSGEYNSDYEYKKYGFPSREEYIQATSYGYQNYDDWKVVKDLLGSNVTTTQVVTPASDVSSTEVDGSGNIVVSSGNSVQKKGSGSGVGGLALGALALKVMGVI